MYKHLVTVYTFVYWSHWRVWKLYPSTLPLVSLKNIVLVRFSEHIMGRVCKLRV